MADLSGKVALITGAGQGIGQGVALAMAGAGAAVAVTGRTLSKVEQTAQLVRERGGTALALPCNVKSASEIPWPIPWPAPVIRATLPVSSAIRASPLNRRILCLILRRKLTLWQGRSQSA